MGRHQARRGRRGGAVGSVSYPTPRDVWGLPPSLRSIKYTRVRHFKRKIQKGSPQRGPARMFPRAPLWLSTDLGITCRMGSHSVACHPTQVNASRLETSQTCRYSIYLPRRDRRLSWLRCWLCAVPRRFSCPQTVTHAMMPVIATWKGSHRK